MSSPESQSLFTEIEAFEDAQKRVDRLIVQLGHLVSHIPVEGDPVLQYWIAHVQRGLSSLSFDLEEVIRSWRDV